MKVRSLRQVLVLLLCAAMAAVLTARGLGDGLAVTPAAEDGILVLRNGHVIEGKITQVGDFYYVALPEGEIRLKAAEVGFSCRNLEEGYQRQRATMQSGDVLEHLRLAQWCERQGLFDHAAEELADARRADPTHPMIAVLQRRLALATEPKQPEATPTALAQPPVSNEQLDRMIRALPPASVETFAQTIQPLLLRNCSTSGCHGIQSDMKFHLMRTPAGQPPVRRLTQRNLYEVLQYIDREHPEQSRLLSVAVQPHGTAKVAIFSEHQVALYKRLVTWVFDVANRRPPEIPATVDAQSETAAQRMTESDGFGFAAAELAKSSTAVRATLVPARRQTSAESLPPSVPVVARHPQQSAAQQTAPGADQSSANSRRSAPKRGAVVPSFSPADPFDAEIFNRRFHADEAAEPSADAVTH